MNAEIITQSDIPKYATPGSAGLDLCISKDTRLCPGMSNVHMLRTGVHIHLADPRYCGIVTLRSSAPIRYQLMLANGIGVIDSDYQGEIMVAVRYFGQAELTLYAGTCIAQYICVPIKQLSLIHVDEFTGGTTQRGSGGFGSTG